MTPDRRIAVGVDGFRAGWVVAVPRDGTVAWRTFADAAGLFAWADAERVVVGIDVPIGLPPPGRTRACDEAARRWLTGAASSVFSAPSRDRLALGPFGSERYAAVNAGLSSGPRFTRQLWGIMPKIAEVDAELRTAGPDVHERIVEVHPEVSFRAMSPGVGFAGKKTALGAYQRVTALAAAHRIDVLAALDADELRRVNLDDALDALAVAWTADRWRRGTAEVLPPGAPIPDEDGVPMRIVI